MQTMTNENNWENLVMVLTEQTLKLSRIGSPFPPEALKAGFMPFLRMLFSEEERCRAQADAAAKAYIATGEWPEQDMWTSHFNFLRLLCAADFAAQQRACDCSGFVPACPRKTRRESVLSWLCIDHWQRCCDSWLKLHAVSLFYSLPLFGLEPAGS